MKLSICCAAVDVAVMICGWLQYSRRCGSNGGDDGFRSCFEISMAVQYHHDEIRQAEACFPHMQLRSQDPLLQCQELTG